MKLFCQVWAALAGGFMRALSNAARPEESFFDRNGTQPTKHKSRIKGAYNSNPYRFHGKRYPFQVAK